MLSIFRYCFFGYILILLLIITGCSKNDLELEISKQPTQPVDTESQVPVFNEEVDGKPLIEVTAQDTVKIMVRADGAPGMYLGDDKKVHGFYVDLETMIMKEMGQKYEFIPYVDVGVVYQALKSGAAHIGLAAPDLADYRSFVDLSIPYEVLNYVTFVRFDNRNIKGSTKEELIKSLFGKKVGVQTQGHIFQTLREYKEIKLIEYPTTTKAMEDLNNGELDAVPDVKRIGLYYAKKNKWKIKLVGKPILSLNLTTGFSKRFSKSLINRYNRALTAIISDGRFDDLYGRYFGPITSSEKP